MARNTFADQQRTSCLDNVFMLVIRAAQMRGHLEEHEIHKVASDPYPNTVAGGLELIAREIRKTNNACIDHEKESRNYIPQSGLGLNEEIPATSMSGFFSRMADRVRNNDFDHADANQCIKMLDKLCMRIRDNIGNGNVKVAECR